MPPGRARLSPWRGVGNGHNAFAVESFLDEVAKDLGKGPIAFRLEIAAGAPRLIVSKDDYILDGHHRWAAKIGLDAASGKLRDDLKMKVSRVNVDIVTLLDEANKFTGGKGAKAATEMSFGDLLYRVHTP